MDKETAYHIQDILKRTFGEKVAQFIMIKEEEREKYSIGISGEEEDIIIEDAYLDTIVTD